ncbi:MAG: DUF2818 family protein [Noviherbaspirillum sp.]
MDLSASGWFVILLALCAANLPFINERLFGLIPLRRPAKPAWVRLGELAAWYAAVGGAARLLEGRIGSVFPQGWEFYAITACLFLVLAFPGYVYRYLRRGR